MRNIPLVEQESLMSKSAFLCGLVFLATPVLASAKDFPLDWKTLTAEESVTFPGGVGMSGTLQAVKPNGIHKEPPPVSKHRLYGQLGRSTNGFLFRLDESKGDGKGYDCLLVDLNQNGDLTDDAAASPVEQPKSAAKVAVSDQTETILFGPIPAPENRMIGGRRPIYYARMYHYKQRSGLLQPGGSAYLGFLRLRAGWYLETTVELDGIRQKIGIVDGDSDLTLGDPSTPITTRDGKEWYFQGGDCFLRDFNSSGKFERSATESTLIPFGPILYFGAAPWKAALSPDCKSLALEPWPEALAELALQPHGEQVQSVEVAWEASPGKWQLLDPGVENGKARVPPGNYRLIDCQLKVETAAGHTLAVTGGKMSLSEPVKAGVDAPTPFKCGAPLEVHVKCERSGRQADSEDSTSGSFWGRLFGKTSGPKPVEQLIQIQAWIVGAGGETYRDFTLICKDHPRQPPSPTFTITAAGKEVASGKLEYG
jgi:hypothetical protein